MLFITLCNVRGGTFNERLARRIDWVPPDGIHVIAEYWLSTRAPHIVMVVEADSAAQILAANAEWDDIFDITVHPAVTAEEGLQLARARRDKELEEQIMAH